MQGITLVKGMHRGKVEWLINKIILLGRLTRNPEVRYTEGAKGSMAIARYDLAVQRKFKKQGETDVDFFNCVSFGKQAEAVEKYLKQGSKILISGRVQNNNYTNKEGQKVSSVQIMVEELKFAESKNANAEQGQPVGQRQNNTPTFNTDGFMNIPEGNEEELPFF